MSVCAALYTIPIERPIRRPLTYESTPHRYFIRIPDPLIDIQRCSNNYNPNMYDAWQAQQKARKDQERRAKTEAAAALQGYRKAGLSVEEAKLADLKEQERLQKLNAQQQLRGYRSQLTEDEARLAAQKQEELRKKQEYEEQLRNNGVVSPNGKNSGLAGNSGLVSSLAAGYSSPNKLQPPLSKKSSAPSKSTPAVVADNVAAAQEAPEALAAAPSSPAPVSPSPKPYQSAVKFMFGILTQGEQTASFPQDRSKLVEGYLARADQIAKAVISENNSSTSSFGSILLSMAYPTASSVKKDECKCFDLFKSKESQSRRPISSSTHSKLVNFVSNFLVHYSPKRYQSYHGDRDHFLYRTR